MIRVELVDAEGYVRAVLASPVVPQSETVTLTWGDESEVWHVEDVLDMQYRLEAAEGVYELVSARVSVTKAGRFA